MDITIELGSKVGLQVPSLSLMLANILHFSEVHVLQFPFAGQVSPTTQKQSILMKTFVSKDIKQRSNYY